MREDERRGPGQAGHGAGPGTTTPVAGVCAHPETGTLVGARNGEYQKKHAREEGGKRLSERSSTWSEREKERENEENECRLDSGVV